MTDQSDATGQAEPNPFAAAVDQMQQTARWLLTVFAAIAGVLLAGTQLSNLGHLTLSDYHLWVAVLAGLLALTLIGRIIWTTAQVLTQGHVTRVDLVHPAKATQGGVELTDLSLLGGYVSVAALLNAYDAVIKDRFTSIEANDTAKVQDDETKVEYLGALVSGLTAAAYYNNVRRLFQEAMRTMFIFGAPAAIAIVGFVWAVNPPTPSTATPSAPAVPDQPAEATLRLAGADIAAITTVGKPCARKPIHVIVLSADTGQDDLVTVPTAACKLVRLTVNPSLDRIQPIHSVKP